MVEFYNCFEVPAGLEDEFLRLWTEVNVYMVAKPGYVSHELHRSLRPDARFRFLNHAVWESAEHWGAAHDAGFREMLGRAEWAPFRSVPALYEVVHSGRRPEYGAPPHGREGQTDAHALSRSGS